jgi:lysophospholipase L1-like esterase
VDAGEVLLGNDGKIDETLFTDGLHPNAEGYTKLAQQMLPYLKSKQISPVKK